MREHSEPRLSVVLIVRRWSGVFELVLDRINRQTIAGDFELILVTDREEGFPEAIERLRSVGSVRAVKVDLVDSEGLAKTAGVRAARAPLVAFLEDHTFPDAKWAEALVNRHESGDFAGVGPVVGNANPRTGASWGCFLVYYGKDAAAQPENELRSLPANHSCYQRDLLLEYGDRMEDMLEAEWVLQGDLLERGFRLYQDPAAKSYHLNYAAVSAASGEYFIGARIFAAARAAEWGVARRFVYAAGSSILPLIRAPRVMGDGRRASIESRILCRAFVPMFAILAAGAAGEMMGYAFGDGDARTRLIEYTTDRDSGFSAGELEEALHFQWADAAQGEST